MKMRSVTILALICGFTGWMMWNIAIWLSIDNNTGHLVQIGANAFLFFFLFLWITEEPTPHDRITR